MENKYFEKQINAICSNGILIAYSIENTTKT